MTVSFDDCLDKLKRVMDPELLEQDPPRTLTNRTHGTKALPPPETRRKLNARATEMTYQVDKNGKRPPHERPTIFPKGLKRPDLTASVDGDVIASEF